MEEISTRVRVIKEFPRNIKEERKKLSATPPLNSKNKYLQKTRRKVAY